MPAHPSFNTLTVAQITTELTASRDAVRQKFNVDSRYFRPPYGNIDARAREILGSMGLETIMWDIDVQDWIYLNNDPSKMQLAAFKQQLDAGGTLVVAHYLYSSTVNQLEDMIVYAKSKGHRFVLLDECLGVSTPVSPPAPVTPQQDTGSWAPFSQNGQFSYALFYFHHLF
jgi:peptidoglycan/xylan/chitin deacetylase (PgdA/CDA1 family)